MVVVPAGVFWMGCNLDPGSPNYSAFCLSSKSIPQHEVHVPSFEIDVHETKAREIIEFLNAKSASGWINECTYKGMSGKCVSVGAGSFYENVDNTWGTKPGKDQFPAFEATWFAAGEYCSMFGKRLCTEAEWEKAASGGCDDYAGVDCKEAMPLYPWGNSEPTCELAQYIDCGPWIMPVGVHPDGASVYGVEDMAGNVYEWVEDRYHTSYLAAPTDGTAWDAPGTPTSTEYRVLRGGDYLGGKHNMRTSYRFPANPDYGIGGIRCCRSVQ
jgi:formylglycine-generating enzyme required for sulfatase activity